MYLKKTLLKLEGKSSDALSEYIKKEVTHTSKKLKIHFLQPELSTLSTDEKANEILEEINLLYFPEIEDDFLFNSFLKLTKATCYSFLNDSKKAIQEVDFFDLNSIEVKDFGNLLGPVTSVYVQAFKIALQHNETSFFNKKLNEFNAFIEVNPKLFFCNSKLDRLRIEANYIFRTSILIQEGKSKQAMELVNELLKNKYDFKLVLNNKILYNVLLVSSYCALLNQDKKLSLKLINLFFEKIGAKQKTLEAELLNIFIHAQLRNLEYIESAIPVFYASFKIKPKTVFRRLLNKLKKNNGAFTMTKDQEQEFKILFFLQPKDLIRWANN